MPYKFVLFLVLAVALCGCARKHIPSSPPGQPEPGVVEATVDGDAPEEVATTPDPAAAPEAEPHAAAPSDVPEFTEAELPAEETAVMQGKAPEADTVQRIGEGLVFVQVGAFEDPDKARRILADLMAEGYSGSRMVKDGPLLKVQAGGFSDEAAARAAKAGFLEQYPGSFITR